MACKLSLVAKVRGQFQHQPKDFGSVTVPNSAQAKKMAETIAAFAALNGYNWAQNEQVDPPDPNVQLLDAELHVTNTVTRFTYTVSAEFVFVDKPDIWDAIITALTPKIAALGYRL